jgi:hypothetical protein
MAASTPPEPAGVGRHVIESIEVSSGQPVTEVRANEVSAHVAATLDTGRVMVRVRTRHGARTESSRACGEEPRVVTGGDAAAHFGLGERPGASRSAKRARPSDKKKVAEKKDREGREE